MKVVDAVGHILKNEGVEVAFGYPTTPLMESFAAVDIRTIICRQERTGVHMADGFSRISNGKRLGVFVMQYGPGCENAFAGVATAFSDSSPLLVLPLGHIRDRAMVAPLFNSVRVFRPVTKWVENLTAPDQISNVMRRALSLVKNGRGGPVMVEIPDDIASMDVPNLSIDSGSLPASEASTEGSHFSLNVDKAKSLSAYSPVSTTRSAGSQDDIEKAVKTLLKAQNPIIIAGQGVMYAEASNELVELAEILQIPVFNTLEGKSAFPENHPLALGTGSIVAPRQVIHFLKKADVVFAIGTSLTRHIMSMCIPPGKTIIHSTNDHRDINKDYEIEYPILGDAKLVLQQLIKAVKEKSNNKERDKDDSIEKEIVKIREEWLSDWRPKITSKGKPINPYRVIWDFVNNIDLSETIATHDSGSPRDQITPFYPAPRPRSYIGWGKSHALGTGLGLIMGAKVAAPDKFCVNFMGDAAFGMAGLDFETSVRCNLPITTIVFNNYTMAIETHHMKLSNEKYRTRDTSGDYAAMGKAMGGHSEKIEDPDEIIGALKRAKEMNEKGKSVLLEFITNEEIDYSHHMTFGYP